MTYKFDSSAASLARGKSRLDHLDRVIERNAPDPPVPASTIQSMANALTKKLERASDHVNRNLSLSINNSGFCKPCRRIFDGNGSYVLPLSRRERGIYYTHWDARYLEKSALRGCPLCLLIYKALDTQLIALTRAEVIPAHYDISEYHSDGKIYSLGFSYYVMLSKEDDVAPVNLGPVLITVHEKSNLRLLTDGVTATSSTQSPESLAQVSKWLKGCDSYHTCSAKHVPGATPFLPTRLVDVGTISGPECVRLVDSKMVPPASKYLTVSHCWGSSEAMMSVELVDQFEWFYKEALPLHQLPKVLLDVIVVAQALGIRYVWVDTLCIMQNNEEDWKKEAAMMWEVYSNAYLNIAATASSNSTQGLFRERTPFTTKACSATVREGHSLFAPGEYLCYDQNEWSRKVNRGPVNTRAWVYQEWLLSPRIVHFAEDQIFWECRDLRASETFPGGIPYRYNTDASRSLLHSKDDLHSKKAFLKVWDSIVRTYTDRKLTQKSDKLIAVSALARQMSRTHPAAGTYLAGLWKNYVIDQLFWSASASAVRSPTYRAPTWSWASIDGPVISNFNWSDVGGEGERQRSREMAKILDVTTVTKDDPFDSVSSGELHISGPLLKVTLDPDLTPPKTLFEDVPDKTSHDFGIDLKYKAIIQNDPKKLPLGPRGFHMRLGKYSDAEGWLDDDRDLTKPHELYFMPLLCFNDYHRGSDEEEMEISHVRGLILEPAGTAQIGRYRRCGTCSINEYDVGKLFCELGNQDPEAVDCESRADEKLTLDDFLPPEWNGKDLSFIPKDFDCYVITII